MNIQDQFPLGLTALISWPTLKSLLQHYSSKVSVLWHSSFFMVQLSHPYVTTRKTIALTRWTYISKVTSLVFNILSVIAFIPRSKNFLISCLQSPSSVILEPKKINCVPVSIVFHLFAMTGYHDLHFFNTEF